MISRSAINMESHSGDEERSGDLDSGDDRGGVSRGAPRLELEGSALASAASTQRTISFEDDLIQKKRVSIKLEDESCILNEPVFWDMLCRCKISRYSFKASRGD